MLTSNNPWKGVLPYTDDPEDLFLHPFRGRDKAVDELIEVIDNNEITTLYGRSGIGKSSLIRAGIFPRLSENHCFPIYIKFQALGVAFAKQITDMLEPIAHYKDDGASANTDFAEDPAYLWNYFSRHDFKKDGHEVLPVIVLDQFEENLRNAPSESVTLLRQLRIAKQEGFRENGIRYEINYRFVISLREDDLYLLEDAIDQNYIDKMKTGRYRLLPIDKVTATNEIIFIRDGLYGQDKNEIASKLINFATSLQDKSVSSIMLSLVCSMAYEAANGGLITLDIVNRFEKENPLMTFYRQSIHKIDDNGFEEYFETNFIDGDRKKTVLVSRIPVKYINYIEKLADEKNDRRILTNASPNGTTEKAYELLHDRIAEAIVAYKEVRNEELRQAHLKARRKKGFIFASVTVLLTILFAVLIHIDKQPLEYQYLGDLGGQSVPIHTKSYHIKDSILRLSDCWVRPYTFYGNKEVVKVELDGVSVQSNGIYLPNVDSVVIGPRQWGKDVNLEEIAPNATVIIAKRPDVFPLKWPQMSKLDKVIYDEADSNFVHWDQQLGALYVRNSPAVSWQACLSKYSDVYYSPKTISDRVNGGKNVIDIDLANIPEHYDLGESYRLINTSPSIRSVRKGDVPSYLLKNLVFVDMQYVDSIAPESMMEIGDLKKLTLPSVKYVGEKAFYNSNIESILLDSVLFIASKAFMKDKSRWGNIENIWLPNIDTCSDSAFTNNISNKTIVQYNPDAAIKDISLQNSTNHSFAAKNDEDSDILDDCGYYFSGDTLFITSSHIKELHVDRYFHQIVIEAHEPCIDKIKLSYTEADLFLWHGDLYQFYKGDLYQLIRCNKSVMISDPKGVIYNDEMALDKCRKYICLNRADIEYKKKRINCSTVDLYVPFGQSENYRFLDGTFSSVNELSWIKTVWYRLFYTRIVNVQTIIPRYTRFGVSGHDIITFTGGVLLLLSIYLLSIFCKLKRWRKTTILDFLVLLIILGVSIYIAVCMKIGQCVITSDGNVFYSITKLFEYLQKSEDTITKTEIKTWPGLIIATLIWCAYLAITIRLNKKKLRLKKKCEKQPKE